MPAENPCDAFLLDQLLRLAPQVARRYARACPGLDGPAVISDLYLALVGRVRSKLPSQCTTKYLVKSIWLQARNRYTRHAPRHTWRQVVEENP